MYVLIGSNGNITSKAARILLSQGSALKVVGRSAKSLEGLRAEGAEIAVGDVADTHFLARVMRGADAVYTMIPPDYGTVDMLAHYDRIGSAVAGAVAASGVHNIVNLSSSGANLSAGTGPIVGLHAQEQRLDALEGVNVLHLRPGYFFENHFSAIGTIKDHGVYADMVASDARIPSIFTGDIAAVVARELTHFATCGHAVLHLRAPTFYTQAKAASILGSAIGIPGLQHVQANPATAKAAMVAHGMSADVADRFEEMSAAFSGDAINAAVDAGPTEITATRLEEFAVRVFAPAFKAA